MNIITTLVDFINITKNKIDEIAKRNGFKIREGKLKPETFVMAMTVGQAELHEVTLDTIAGKCEEYQDGLEISKQAIHQRMLVGSKVMKEVFDIVYNDMLRKAVKLICIDILKQFTDIKINDGTTISLPDKLEGLYKGLGGKNAKSALKIQATYSVFQNEFVGLDTYSATKNDATYNNETLKKVNAGELIIKDLGYYDKDYFYNIEQKRAFYISRIKTNSVIYTKNNGVFDSIKFRMMLKKSMNDIDINIFIKLSTGDMHKVRLVGIRLPEKVSNERKRKAYKNAQSKGKQLTEEEIVLLDWYIVITNVPSDMLSINTLCELYRLRWQIELQFKALKSSLDFDKFSNVGENYFQCVFYGKMIMCLLTMKLFSICRSIKFNETKRLISVQKFVRNFRNNIKNIVAAILNPTKKVLVNFEQIILKIAKRSVFDVRNRVSTEENLMSHDLPENALFMLVTSNF